MATSQAAENPSQNSNGPSQQEDAPWTFAGAPGGSPFANGGHHGVEYPTRERSASFATTAGGTGNIVYHANGGIISAPKLFVIWYGSWASTACADMSSTTSTGPSIIGNMLNAFGSSAWNSIDKSYYQVLNNTVSYVAPTMPVAGCMVNPSLQGTTLNTPFVTATAGLKSINDVVTYGLNNGLTTDINGIYLVLTSSDVVVNGFVNSTSSQFCGYHDNLVAPNTTNVKFAMVGDAGTHLASCAGQTAFSPNSNPSADAMASVIAHEIVETVTDPLGNTWYDGAGWENGDKCAWDFGTTADVTILSSGAKQNTVFGGRGYLIQQNLEANTSTCLLQASALPSAPTITSFTPTTSAVGSTITITGTNFMQVSAVGIGGVLTPTFTVTGTTSISVKIPTGAVSGPVTVRTISGTATSATSITIPLSTPTITSFTPTFGSPVTITGTNLLGATGVSFNGAAGTITGTPTATSLTATPPSLGTSGKITVTTPGGTSAASTAIYYFPAGVITAPASAAVGATITITGTNLLGATKVNFGGVSATPATTATLTSLTVKVPTGATSGTITVTTPAGISPSASFAVVLPAPTITSFTPSSGTRNATTVNTVTITGSNLLGATSVTLTGVSGVTIKSGGTATSLAVTFTLPLTLATSTTAKFTVVTPAGSVTSTGSFSIK